MTARPSPSRQVLDALGAIIPDIPEHDILPFLLPPVPTPAPRQRKRSTPRPRQAEASSSSSASGSSHPVPPYYRQVDDSSRVPYKYESRSGHWVKSDCWVLHGRGNCRRSNSTNSQDLEEQSVTLDYTASSTSTSLSPSPTSSAPISTSSTPQGTSTSALDMATLPKGWAPKRDRTTLYPIPGIVIGSVVLAGLIVVAIWVLGRMRRRRRIRLEQQDLEQQAYNKKQKALDSDDDSFASVGGKTLNNTKRVAGKYAKLRWRGVGKRLIPRRRKPPVHVPAVSDDKNDGDGGDGGDGGGDNENNTPGPPHALLQDTPLDGPSEPTLLPADPSPESPITPPPPATPSFPPAYRRQQHLSSSSTATSEPPRVLPSDSHDLSSEAERSLEAHVATDDKARLALMERLTSEPPLSPDDEEAVSGSSSIVDVQPVAPQLDEIEEDEIEESDHSSMATVRETSVPDPSLPSSNRNGKAPEDRSRVPHVRHADDDETGTRPPSWRPASSSFQLPTPPTITPSTSREYARLAGSSENLGIAETGLQALFETPISTTSLPIYPTPSHPEEDGVSAPPGDNDDVLVPSAPPLELDEEVVASAPPLEE